MSDTNRVTEQVDDLLMRVELLETRLSMLEDFIREEEAKKDMATEPDAKRSFRHV